MRLSVMWAVLALVGCSARGDLYWGWQCEGNPRSGEWDCEQRLLRDGLPVDESELNRVDIPARPVNVEPTNAASPNRLPTAVVLTSMPQAPPSEWKQQLPDLDGGLQAPPKKAEPYEAVVDKGRPPVDTTPPPQPEPEPYRSVVNTPPAEPAPKTTGVSAQQMGYTLQLVALRNEKDIEQFITHQRLVEIQLTRSYIRSRGENWYVLTTGFFADRAAAERAGHELARKYPGLHYWVRSLQSLLAAAKEAEANTAAYTDNARSR